MSQLPNLDQLSDKALLELYARGKLNLMFYKLFNRPRPSPHIISFVHQLSEEISARGLDQKHGPTADSDS